MSTLDAVLVVADRTIMELVVEGRRARYGPAAETLLGCLQAIDSLPPSADPRAGPAFSAIAQALARVLGYWARDVGCQNLRT